MRTKDRLHISVLLTAFNAERWLEEAISSALNQTYQHFELLLVDDGSTDDTAEIMEKFANEDDRIRIISHSNWGLARSLNHAMQFAKYDWIARFDADDIMMPDRLERQVRFIEEHKDVAVFSCYAYYINERGKHVGYQEYDLLPSLMSEDRLENNKLIYVMHTGVIMRRDIILSVGGYRPEFSTVEDLDLWQRVAEAGYLILNQPEYLMKMRIHPDSVSRQGARLQTVQTRWLEDSIRRRRSGQPELSFEDFLRYERSAPILSRANNWRRDTGQILYKQATGSYTSGHWLQMCISLAGSLVLSPTYCVNNIWQKQLRSKLARSSLFS